MHCAPASSAMIEDQATAPATAIGTRNMSQALCIGAQAADCESWLINE